MGPSANNSVPKNPICPLVSCFHRCLFTYSDRKHPQLRLPYSAGQKKEEIQITGVFVADDRHRTACGAGNGKMVGIGNIHAFQPPQPPIGNFLAPQYRFSSHRLPERQRNCWPSEPDRRDCPHIGRFLPHWGAAHLECYWSRLILPPLS